MSDPVRSLTDLRGLILPASHSLTRSFLSATDLLRLVSQPKPHAF
ncbi:hypothetical protein [Oxalicibacterium faecigallinarum]|nr:hypothetical protein [Oxalicibacterium faecigallinarum]